MEAQDKALKLNTLYRAHDVRDRDRIAHIAQQAHKDLDDVISPEPDEDLEDSELKRLGAPAGHRARAHAARGPHLDARLRHRRLAPRDAR